MPQRLNITRDELAQALATHGGNHAEAARVLGCSRATIIRRVAEETAAGHELPAPLSHVVRTDPARAKAMILDALEATEGNRGQAAEMLCVSNTTWLAAVKRLRLRDEIANRWPYRGVQSDEHLERLRENAQHARDSITEWTATPQRLASVRENLAKARAAKVAKKARAKRRKKR